MTRPHYSLNAWKESMGLVCMVYRVSHSFPREEIYGLTSQIRRSAISVPSNLAEGAARQGYKEFDRFINIAKGSLSELDTQLHIAVSLGYLNSDSQVFIQIDKVSSLLAGLQKSLMKRMKLTNK